MTEITLDGLNALIAKAKELKKLLQENPEILEYMRLAEKFSDAAVLPIPADRIRCKKCGVKKLADLINSENLDQLTVEIKFYVNQWGQNTIEIGKRLIAAKKLVEHGDWSKWLEKIPEDYIDTEELTAALSKAEDLQSQLDKAMKNVEKLKKTNERPNRQ